MIPRDRLVLGTAKLGMPQYGYNSTSRPTAQESIAILRAAWRAGIERFDTALGYGDAIWLLAEAGIPPGAIICKARLPLTREEADSTYHRWLLHNPTVAEMEAGLVPATWGVSVYTFAEVEAARRLGIAPTQAPASCLNPAVDVDYGRAPFLQGVLLRPPELAPPSLQTAVAAFQGIAIAHRVSPVVLALHAACSTSVSIWRGRTRSSATVVGVSSLAQLDELLAACEAVSPTDEAIDQVCALSRTVDATAAFPSLWSPAHA